VKTRRRRPAQELRATIDRLPLEVRQAVLDGIQNRRIIAGSHVDGLGGLCPMAAADVRWRRIDRETVAKAQQVAWAWDRYAEACGSWHPATNRQLLALKSMLEASILAETTATDVPLSAIIAEHELTKSRNAAADEAAAAVEAIRARVTAQADAPISPVPAAEPAVAPTRRRRRQDTGERDRTRELHERGGWSWLRPFRTYDEYEDAVFAALSELERHQAQVDSPGTRYEESVAR
jgi:hypothetical protein